MGDDTYSCRECVQTIQEIDTACKTRAREEIDAACEARGTPRAPTKHRCVVDTGATTFMVAERDRVLVTHPLRPPKGTVVVAYAKHVTPAGMKDA